MDYLYYPGCSLESSARAYDQTTRWVFKRLELNLKELEDWNCCGATMYMSIKETISLAFSARNLALAEKANGEIIAPCSSCYTILNKTNHVLQENFILRAKVNQSLKRAGLEYCGKVRVRHPLDVLVNDVGVETIRQKATLSLEGVRLAPYYGCQIVRPDGFFDDRENPMTMDRLFASLGATIVSYPVKLRCCGGMSMTTYPEVALRLNREIIAAAVEERAEAIVTTCPLCQLNLDAYQDKINRLFKTDLRIPVLFFTQLLALSLGADRYEAGFKENIVPVPEKLTGGQR